MWPDLYGFKNRSENTPVSGNYNKKYKQNDRIFSQQNLTVVNGIKGKQETHSTVDDSYNIGYHNCTPIQVSKYSHRSMSYFVIIL